MRYTSAEANKLLKSLEDERARMCMMENQSSVFICATQENPDEVRPEYGFLETQCEISVIESKIRKVKHAINVFNTTHEVPGFGMTVDQMLVFIPQLSARKRVLSGMAQRLPKARKQSRYGGTSAPRQNRPLPSRLQTAQSLTCPHGRGQRTGRCKPVPYPSRVPG